MDARSYKGLNIQADVFRRAALEATLDAVAGHDPSLASSLQEVLAKPPVPKPAEHSGGPATNLFQVELTPRQTDAIVDSLGLHEAAAVSPEGETTPKASYYADLLDLWLQYRSHQKAGRPNRARHTPRQ